MDVVVETPKGSHQKFKYDEKDGRFFVNKTLPQNMRFPFNFGFVPQTKGEDGDPLDVIILSEKPYKTGDTVNVKVIGNLPAMQTVKGVTLRNDRFLCVPMDDAQYADITDIRNLDPQEIGDMQSFFVTYAAASGKKLEFEEPMRGAEADSILQLAKSSIGS